MTRDEAIKAMRQGKQFHHKSMMGDGKNKPCIFYYKQGTIRFINRFESEYIFSIHYNIENEEFDDGWEIIKEKVKKTLYQAVRYENGVVLDHTGIYTSKDGLDTEWYLKRPDWCIVSFEIEVEE